MGQGRGRRNASLGQGCDRETWGVGKGVILGFQRYESLSSARFRACQPCGRRVWCVCGGAPADLFRTTRGPGRLSRGVTQCLACRMPTHRVYLFSIPRPSMFGDGAACRPTLRCRQSHPKSPFKDQRVGAWGYNANPNLYSVPLHDLRGQTIW